jgi:hypothetical protein
VAIRNTAWHAVEPGQIVTFRYKSEGSSKAYKRTVLIINPDMRYRKKTTKRIKRFVVGIQIDTQIAKALTEARLKQLFKRVGGLEFEEGAVAGNLPDRMSKASTVKITGKLRPFYSRLRTYSRRVCRRNRVYLELDYARIPDDTVAKFERELIAKYDKLFEE